MMKSFVFSVIILLLSGGVSSSEDSEDENPFMDLAQNLVQGTLVQEGLANLVTGFLEQGKLGGADTGGVDAMNSQLMWQLGESLMGAWMGSGGHRHSDDPEFEDKEAHDKHQVGTDMLTGWIKNAWNQIPPEWTKPVQDILNLFSGPNGIKVEDVFNSMENPAFRKRWIRSMSGFAAQWAKHLSQPEVQRTYLVTGSFAVNQILHSQGWADRELLNPIRPFEESLSKVIDTVMKKQFGLPVHSATYVYPAVIYVKNIIKLGQGSVSSMSTREIDDKLAETINNEIIETVLRVWRAHKFAMRVPQCDQYLICELNRPENFQEGNSTLKPGLTKAASLVSSWFLSGQTGTPFLELYNSAVSNYDCKTEFPVNCSGFHEEDIRMTTEYSHSEL